MAKLTNEQITSVKGKGFLWNRDTEFFSGRVLTGNGTLTAEDLIAVAECAKKFGNGTTAFTSRLTVELPGISLENIEKAQAFLAEKNLFFGGTGAKIRPVTACKGTTCIYGNCDTQGIAQEIHEKYFIGWGDVTLPHKFKIAVGGCPNSCMKPSLNDFGIEGRRPPKFKADKCRGCGNCVIETRCPMNAAVVTDGVLKIDDGLCSKCGLCSGKCPFKTLPRDEYPMYQIFIGGTWGKHPRMGTALSLLVTENEIFPLLEKTMLWFRENGYAKERLGACIDRIGMDKAEAALWSDDLLLRKDEILKMEIQQRTKK